MHQHNGYGRFNHGSSFGFVKKWLSIRDPGQSDRLVGRNPNELCLSCSNMAEAGKGDGGDTDPHSVLTASEKTALRVVPICSGSAWY
jgi:hypothetical protein